MDHFISCKTGVSLISPIYISLSINMMNATAVDGLLGNYGDNREWVLLVKRKNQIFKIIITVILMVVFPMVLFWSNIEYLFNFGLHSLEVKKVLCVLGQDPSLGPVCQNWPTLQPPAYPLAPLLS